MARSLALLLPLALVVFTRAEIDAADEAACVSVGGTAFIAKGAPKVACCRAPDLVTWIDQGRKIGNCCPEGHTWTGDKATGKGGCCPTGNLWSLGQCKPAVNTPLPTNVGGADNIVDSILAAVGGNGGKGDGKDGKDAASQGDKSGGSDPDDDNTEPDDISKDQKPGAVAKSQGQNVCRVSGTPVCGSDKDLGVRYGHCYILSFADGAQLGAQRDNPSYAKGGYMQDVPFKVCQSTSHCGKGVVPRNGTFYLQDQIGRHDDPQGKLGWIDGASGGGHMKFVIDAKQAGLFRGTPQCSKGDCSIKLQGATPGKRGLSPTCPTANHGITFRQNPRIGVTFHFTETSCANGFDPYF